MITDFYKNKPKFEDGKVASIAEHREFVCAAEDVPNLPGADTCLPGSIAWVVSEGKFYGFDGTNWVEQ